MNESSTQSVAQFYVGGMACAFCASTIEKGLRHIEGVTFSKVLMESGEVFVRHDSSKVSRDRLRRELERLGYYAFESRENAGAVVLADSRRRALSTWALASVSFLLVFPMMFPGVLTPLVPREYESFAVPANFVIATVVFFYFAWPIHRGAVVALRRRILNEHVLYGVAGLAAYVLGLAGFFAAAYRPFLFIAVLLTGLHLTAGWLGARIRFHVEESVRKLMDLRPLTARVLRGDEEAQVSLRDVRVGNLVLVRPGEKIPLDGVVAEGISEVAEGILTGESLPVTKGAGDQVLGGSTNGNGSLKVRVTTDADAGYVSRILGLVRSAKQERSAFLSFFDRIVDRVWVPLVLGIAGLTVLAWTVFGLATGNPSSWQTGFVSALLVAVIGYPCAIGFSSPSVGLSAFTEYANQGILVKDATLFERLKDARTAIFDKTGTLTYGRPAVSRIVVAPGVEEEMLLRFAGTLEKESSHPIAQSVVEAAERRGVPLVKCAEFRETPGGGASGSVEGRRVVVGTPEFLVAQGFDPKEIEELLRRTPEKPKSPVVVGVDGLAYGLFEVKDALRTEAVPVITAMQRAGLDVIMVTGDTEETASEIATALGGIRFHARRSPAQKIELVTEYKRKGKVLMIGDGFNDAAALAAADVGIATAASIDVSKDVADAVLVSNDLRGITALWDNARPTARASASNVLLAFAFNAVGIPLAVVGLLSSLEAMLIMVLSLVGVFGNAFVVKMRLRRRLVKGLSLSAGSGLSQMATS